MSQNTTIFLVRHGETEWNKQNRLQGNKDSPLTDCGMKQARKTKASLDKFTIDYAYVSPLKRAIDISEIILEGRKVKAVIKDNLREINLGPWEGKTRREIAHSHPIEYNAFWERPDLFSLAGADKFQEFQKRVVRELESIFVIRENSYILVVSHWIAIKVALAYYLSIPLSNLTSIIDPVNGGYICLSKRGNNVHILQQQPNKALQTNKVLATRSLCR